MEAQNYWRKCSSCKKEISFDRVYQACSVSSCRKYAYCSVTCWDVHVPVMNHKSAWAEENRSPTREEFFNQQNSDRPRRRIVASKSTQSEKMTTTSKELPMDILIVASKLKKYVKAKYDLNTSASVMEALSEVVRHACDDAASKARQDGRKTLMDRDF